MAEAIHCPSCSTRYRLRPERLKPAIRRAKCFTCGGLFPVGDIVQRLLALPAPEATTGFTPADGAAKRSTGLEPTAASAPPLTLGDLEGSEGELLEKHLVEIPTSLPETRTPVPPPFPREITETTLSGYTSARDAIDKLFGSAPAAPVTWRANQDRNNMDMEATLSALDATLGPPTTLPSGVSEMTGDNPTASGLTEADLVGPSSSTLRLSREDFLAVRGMAPAPAVAPAEPTVAMRASDLVPTSGERSEGMPPASTSRSYSPLATPPDPGAELLRLKIGEEIYGGLTMPQLIAWVEEGRILPNHLVARQQSENWLEAHKVPGLRPVFERLRRERSDGAPSLDSGIGDKAPKRSLFGGLFGRN